MVGIIRVKVNTLCVCVCACGLVLLGLQRTTFERMLRRLVNWPGKPVIILIDFFVWLAGPTPGRYEQHEHAGACRRVADTPCDALNRGADNWTRSESTRRPAQCMRQPLLQQQRCCQRRRRHLRAARCAWPGLAVPAASGPTRSATSWSWPRTTACRWSAGRPPCTRSCWPTPAASLSRWVGRGFGLHAPHAQGMPVATKTAGRIRSTAKQAWCSAVQ